MKDKFVCIEEEDNFYHYSIGNGAEQIFSNHKLSEEFNKAIDYHVDQISKEINKRILHKIKNKT